MPKTFKFEPPHVGSYNEWIFQTRSYSCFRGPDLMQWRRGKSESIPGCVKLTKTSL